MHMCMERMAVGSVAQPVFRVEALSLFSHSFLFVLFSSRALSLSLPRVDATQHRFIYHIYKRHEKKKTSLCDCISLHRSHIFWRTRRQIRCFRDDVFLLRSFRIYGRRQMRIHEQPVLPSPTAGRKHYYILLLFFSSSALVPVQSTTVNAIDVCFTWNNHFVCLNNVDMEFFFFLVVNFTRIHAMNIV